MNREIDKDIENIATDVIHSVPELEELCVYVDVGKCNIAYLKADGHKKSKGKVVLADCRPVTASLKPICSADFVITVYADADDLDENQMKILLWHELRHINIEAIYEEQFKTVGHDYEDFKSITDLFGTEWNNAEAEGLPDICSAEFWKAV